MAAPRRALDGARVGVRRAFNGVIVSIGSERVLLSRTEAIAFAAAVAVATVPTGAEFAGALADLKLTEDPPDEPEDGGELQQ